LEEQYLGGFESGRLVKKGSIAGYGIYATDMRIIGVKSRKALLKGLAGAALGGVTGAYIGMRLSKDQSVKMIQELDERKDFEVAKSDVSNLELKKPSFVSRGHLVISTNTGDAIKIIIASKKDFKDLVSLMSQFSQAQMTTR
jgi:outer membrane lipoprotein SlyB